MAAACSLNGKRENLWGSSGLVSDIIAARLYFGTSCRQFGHRQPSACGWRIHLGSIPIPILARAGERDGNITSD
ncbi:hypothetical protein [Kamptonema formosum]|uniref:hypothetical protein n=1 Tax=Kamptonema formosum TaxID=331992 RepID=UPI000347620A|nr:hypothetical protein [Oscillatoria sp. PCC 10802]